MARKDSRARSRDRRCHWKSGPDAVITDLTESEGPKDEEDKAMTEPDVETSIDQNEGQANETEADQEKGSEVSNQVKKVRFMGNMRRRRVRRSILSADIMHSHILSQLQSAASSIPTIIIEPDDHHHASGRK